MKYEINLKVIFWENYENSHVSDLGSFLGSYCHGYEHLSLTSLDVNIEFPSGGWDPPDEITALSFEYIWQKNRASFAEGERQWGPYKFLHCS